MDVVKSLIKNTQEFFDFVESINKQKISITFQYPIIFSKVNEGIEVKYNLYLNQLNKKAVKLKK